MRRAPGTGSVYQPTFKTKAGKWRKTRTYWIAYLVGGETKRENAHTESRATAKTPLRTRLSPLDRGENPAPSRLTFEQLAGMIRDDYKANGRKSASRLERSLKHLTRARQARDSPRSSVPS